MITDDSSRINSLLPLNILLCSFLNVIPCKRSGYKEEPYKWVERVKIRKRRFLACSIDSVIHGTEMELGARLNMFLSLKSLLFRFYYFVSFFFSLCLFFFLIQQIPEGEKKEVFTSSPQRNTNYADEKFTTFHRPSPFSHRPPLTSTRRITVRQVTNESCIIFTARSRISRKMSRGHYPRHFSPPPSFLFFSLFFHPRGFFRVARRPTSGISSGFGFFVRCFRALKILIEPLSTENRSHDWREGN